MKLQHYSFEGLVATEKHSFCIPSAKRDHKLADGMTACFQAQQIAPSTPTGTILLCHLPTSTVLLPEAE